MSQNTRTPAEAQLTEDTRIDMEPLLGGPEHQQNGSACQEVVESTEEAFPVDGNVVRNNNIELLKLLPFGMKSSLFDRKMSSDAGTSAEARIEEHIELTPMNLSHTEIQDHHENGNLDNREEQNATGHNGSDVENVPEQHGNEPSDEELDSQFKMSVDDKDQEACKQLFLRRPYRCLEILNEQNVPQKLVKDKDIDFLLFLLEIIPEKIRKNESAIQLLEHEDSVTRCNILFQMMETLEVPEVGLWEKFLQKIKSLYGKPKLDRLLRIKHPMRDNTIFHIAIEKKNEKLCEHLVSLGTTALLTIEDAKGNTPLHNLVSDTDLKSILDMWIKQSKENGLNPVHVAANHGYSKVLKHLLENGCTPDNKRINKFTCMQIVAKNGHLACTKILLQYIENGKMKEYANATTEEGATALMLATEHGFRKICDLLVDHTDLSIADTTGNNALHLAVRRGSRSIVRMLLGFKTEEDNMHEIEADVLNKCLLKKNKAGFTPLLLAAKKNDPECLKFLLAKKTLNRDERFELLRCLIMNKSNDCIDTLLDNSDEGVEENNINSSIRIPFTYLDLFDNVFEDGNTFLHLAISKNSYNIAMKILEKNEELKFKENKSGENALHLAAKIPDDEFRKDKCPKIEKLLDKLVKGTEEILNRKTVSRDTCLHLCAMSGNHYLVGLLLKRGANVRRTNENKATAFEIAVQQSKYDVLSKLLEHTNKDVKKKCSGIFQRCLCLAAEKNDMNAADRMMEHIKTEDFMEVSLEALKKSFIHSNCEVFKFLLAKLRRIELGKKNEGQPQTDESERGNTMQEEKEKEKWEAIYNALSIAIHRYARQCLMNGKLDVVEIIIDSEWAFEAFDNRWCKNSPNDESEEPKQSPSLAILFEQHEEMACKLLDKMIKSDEKGDRLNFVLFEQMYYNEDSLKNYQPHYDKKGRLKAGTERFSNFFYSLDHVLVKAYRAKHYSILQHRLTKSWLKLKMKYTRYSLYSNCLLNFLLAYFVTLVVGLLRTETDVMTSCGGNITVAEFCSLYSSDGLNNPCVCSLVNNYKMPSNESSVLCDSSDVAFLTKLFQSLVVILVFLAILGHIIVMIHFGNPLLNSLRCRARAQTCSEDMQEQELENYERFGDCMKRLLNKINFMTNVFISKLDILKYMVLVIMLVPPYCGGFELGLRSVFQFRCGVFALLLCYITLMLSLNRLPAFQQFSPNIEQKVFFFFKGILYIIILSLTYSYIFFKLYSQSPEIGSPFKVSFMAFTRKMMDFASESIPKDDLSTFQFVSSLLSVMLIAVTAFISSIFSGVSADILKKDENSEALTTRNLLISHFYYADFFSSAIFVSKLRSYFRKKCVRGFIVETKKNKKN